MSETVTRPFCFRSDWPEPAVQRKRWNLRGSTRSRTCIFAPETAAAEKLRAFVEEHRVKVLNVAGPRASNEPGVGDFVLRTLEEAFGRISRMDQGC